MKTVATIEARMTSSRLPGKVLLPVGNKPILQVLVERLKKAKSIDEIVLATTTNETDHPLEEFAKTQGIACYRGSEDDVLERVVLAAKSVQADVICEVTGDCPLIDPVIVDKVVTQFNQQSEFAWASNSSKKRSYPLGMDVHVFGFQTLSQVLELTNEPLDHEHVTRYFYSNPDLYPLLGVLAEPKETWPELSLTLDEPGDYELLKKIIETLGVDSPFYSCQEIVQFIKTKKPDWFFINQKVNRRGYNS